MSTFALFTLTLALFSNIHSQVATIGQDNKIKAGLYIQLQFFKAKHDQTSRCPIPYDQAKDAKLHGAQNSQS